MLTAKAYCGRVITEWLAHVFSSAVRGPLRANELIRWAAVTVTLVDKDVFNRRHLKNLLSKAARNPIPSRHADPRNALARFFGLLERSGRYLTLAKWFNLQSNTASQFKLGAGACAYFQMFPRFVSLHDPAAQMRTESQATLLNREGMVFARGHLKLTQISQMHLGPIQITRRLPEAS